MHMQKFKKMHSILWSSNGRGTVGRVEILHTRDLRFESQPWVGASFEANKKIIGPKKTPFARRQSSTLTVSSVTRFWILANIIYHREKFNCWKWPNIENNNLAIWSHWRSVSVETSKSDVVKFAGLAWVGTICSTVSYRTAVVEYFYDDMKTGEVRVNSNLRLLRYFVSRRNLVRKGHELGEAPMNIGHPIGQPLG